MDLDVENPLMNCNGGEEEGQSFESISALFAAESDHMVSGAVYLSVRCDAIALIRQAQFDCNLDPFLVYLAVNYVDRFLSKRENPIEKPWIVRLLAISCLSLASKMKKSNFVLSDLQRGEGFIFDAQTIRRMELMVLGALDWRMRPITPFSFLQFFTNFFTSPAPHLVQALRSHATEILYKSQTEIKILEFKPSVICSAALLAAAYELFPVQLAAFSDAVAASNFVNKEKLRECCSLMMDGYDLATKMISSSDTPVTVLGRHFSSSDTVGSSSDDRDLKKRRIYKNVR